MSDEQKTALIAMAEEWLQIALKCTAVAERHKAKGEKLQYLEQEAYATARRACAQELKRMVEGGI